MNYLVIIRLTVKLRVKIYNITVRAGFPQINSKTLRAKEDSYRIDSIRVKGMVNNIMFLKYWKYLISSDSADSGIS